MAGVGAATASKVVDKIAGSGVVYLKKGGQSYKIIQQGNGLWLRPASEYKMQPLSDGFWMKSPNGGYVDGRGLITGDSPISRALANIPLIGSRLSAII